MFRLVANNVFAGLVAIAVLTPAVANAASQGTMGGTSSGSISINATVPNLVKILKLQDIAFTTNSFPATGSSTFCAYSNVASTYAVTVTSAESSFILKNGGNSVGYAVSWTDSGGTAHSVSYNSKIAGLPTGGANPTCGGGGSTNGSVTITIDEADLGAAPAGVYTGTLNIDVSPN